MYLSPVRGPTTGTVDIIAIDDAYEPGSRSATWSIDEIRCNRTYTNKIKVNCKTGYVGPLTIIGVTGVVLGDSYRCPLYSSSVETDTGSFARSIHAEQDSEDNRQWIVTVEYEPFDVVSLLGSSYLNQGIIYPLDRAWEVFWADAEKYERVKTEDNDPTTPKKWLNTAGDPLIDMPKMEETRPVLCLVRNETTYNDAYASTFKDCVNNAEFLGCPPNTVKCKDIKGERQFDPDFGWYYKVTYEFEFRWDADGNGYSLMIVSTGYRQKVGGTGNPVNVVDAKGETVTDAVGLQANGAYTPGTDPYVMTFTEFPPASFGDLNIPDDILYVVIGDA